MSERNGDRGDDPRSDAKRAVEAQPTISDDIDGELGDSADSYASPARRNAGSARATEGEDDDR